MKRANAVIASVCGVVISLVAACSSSDSSATDEGGGSNACVYKEPGTDFASCKSDDDCFSGWCNTSCKPGACCEHPNTSAIVAGRGYSCKADADCATVATDYLKKQGASARCIYDSLNKVSNGCTFLCSNH